MYGIYDGSSVIARFVVPMTVRSNHPVFASDTLSLNRQISRRSAQRWEIETQLEPLSISAQDLFVDIVTKGYSGAVQVITPQNYGAVRARTASGSGSATVAGTMGQSMVALSGVSGFIPKGTFIKFSNSSKVYMTTSDRTGPGSVGIYPNLIANSSGADTVRFLDDVIMTCSYDLDTVTGMTYQDGILMDVGTIKLIERLP